MIIIAVEGVLMTAIIVCYVWYMVQKVGSLVMFGLQFVSCIYGDTPYFLIGDTATTYNVQVRYIYFHYGTLVMGPSTTIHIEEGLMASMNAPRSACHLQLLHANPTRDGSFPRPTPHHPR